MLPRYLASEVLEGDAAYYCDGCRRKVDRAEKTSELAAAPRHLILALSRFRYDASSKSRRKVDTKLKVTHDLDLPSGHRYALYAVVVHAGASPHTITTGWLRTASMISCSMPQMGSSMRFACTSGSRATATESGRCCAGAAPLALALATAARAAFCSSTSAMRRRWRKRLRAATPLPAPATGGPPRRSSSRFLRR